MTQKESFRFPTEFKILISKVSIQIRATASEWKAGAIRMYCIPAMFPRKIMIPKMSEVLIYIP